MNKQTTLATLLLSASLTCTSVAVFAAGEQNEHRPHHDSPAADAGGTPGEKGVGGSVEVPSAGGGADDITPYDDVGEFDEENERPAHEQMHEAGTDGETVRESRD